MTEGASPESESSGSPAGADTAAAHPRLRLSRLSRRIRTLIVSGVLFAVLFVLSVTLPVPYVILSPGPAYNTLGTAENSNGKTEQIIKITGVRTARTRGSLYLTTVQYSQQRLTIYSALRAWLNSDQEVVPRSAIFPPGVSTNQVNRENKAEFVQSQDSAVLAALCELGYPKAFGVLSVTAHGPSAGVLHVGDVLVSVAGTPVSTYDGLKAALQRERPGTSVPVVVRRDGQRLAVRVRLGSAPEDGTGGTLGIGVPRQPVCLAPFSINLALADQIGGPSAGMMFALGIIDKLGKVDLTSGRTIAGTGTIDPAGNVGAIGGIQLKMIAARDKGATLFLAPAANCSDVVGATPDGLNVIKVSTLHQAVQELRATAAGRPAPHC